MAQAPAPEKELVGFTRPEMGSFAFPLYRRVLEQIFEMGAVLTLTVSSGREERIFFFTRGAILFLAIGPEGGEILAKKLVAKKLLTPEQLEPLILRANSGTPLLQDILENEGILDQEIVRATVAEVLEDYLLEPCYWDGALYDLVPGNPPPRLYEPDVPSVRMSLGVKALIGKVRPRVENAQSVMSTLQGTLRNKVRLAPRTTGLIKPTTKEESILLAKLNDQPRTITEVVASAKAGGIPFVAALDAIAALIRSKHVVLVKVAERTREEDLAQAQSIDQAFQQFVNRLLARTHLAAIYERIHENDKAAEQYHGIAREHFAQDRVQEGLDALREVVRLNPLDVEAREMVVKVLRGLNRAGEAAREAVDLARALIQVGLPGRARAAFELALRLVPGSSGILWMLAGLLDKLGEEDEAVKRYEEIAQLAQKNGDEQGAVAAFQQILALVPDHAPAVQAVNKMTGYGRAMVARWATAIAAVLVLLAVVAFGTFQARAFAAYDDARDRAWHAMNEEKFDVARDIAKKFRDDRIWSLSHFAASGDKLLARIDEEERAVLEQRCAREVRLARKLETEQSLPAALDHWTAARATQDPRRKDEVAAAIQRCEARVSKGRAALAEAERLVRTGADRAAHDLLLSELISSPWLKEAPDVLIPEKIDSYPHGARVLLDGQPAERPTPVIVRRAPVAGNITLEGPGREPLKRTIAATPDWPLAFVLPRKPSWRASVVATTAPLVADDLVVVGGRDRSVSAIAHADGRVVWTNRDALGVFGECHLRPAFVGGAAKLVVARADAGTVAAIDAANGNTRWSREVAPPPVDIVDPFCGRPVACDSGPPGKSTDPPGKPGGGGGGGGVVVRDGARGVVFLEAKDGSPRWRSQLKVDVNGAPAVSGDIVVAVSERSVFAFHAHDGTQAWIARLPRPAFSGPIFDAQGVLHVALESGGITRIDAHEGGVIATDKVGESAELSTPPDSAADRVVVGLSRGEVVAIDATNGKPRFTATLDSARPVLWVRAIDAELTLAGDGAAIYALDGKGGELWRHPSSRSDAARGAAALEPDLPAAADVSRVYASGESGVVAIER